MKWYFKVYDPIYDTTYYRYWDDIKDIVYLCKGNKFYPQYCSLTRYIKELVYGEIWDNTDQNNKRIYTVLTQEELFKELFVELL